MVKYTQHRKQRKQRKQRKSLRRTRRRLPKTLRKRGGYSPTEGNGGNYGNPPNSYPVGQSGALPDPTSAFPTGPSDY